MPRPLALVTAALALAVTLASPVPPAAAAPVTITIANQGDAATLDGHLRNETTTLMIQLHVYERLVSLDANARLEPGLATAWKRTDPTTFDEYVFAHEIRVVK